MYDLPQVQKQQYRSFRDKTSLGVLIAIEIKQIISDIQRLFRHWKPILQTSKCKIKDLTLN